MAPLGLLEAVTKLQQVYGEFCQPVCREFGLSQTDLDVLLFLANHPQDNTARDVCEKRLIKKALVSVTVEKLVQLGYLQRQEDCLDRRVQRLVVLEKAQAAVAAGRRTQKAFFHAIYQNMTQEELQTYFRLQQKMVDTIEKLAQP